MTKHFRITYFQEFSPKNFCISCDANKIALHAIKQYLQAVHNNLRCRSYAGYIIASMNRLVQSSVNWSTENVLNRFLFVFVTAAGRLIFHYNIAFLILTVSCRLHERFLRFANSSRFSSQTSSSKVSKTEQANVVKSVECAVYLCELAKSGVLCQRKFLVATMQCGDALFLHNWIYDSTQVIKRHYVMSLMTALKFISK